MRKIFQIIFTVPMVVLMISMSVISALCAESAKVGDSVAVSVSVSGINNMGSMSVEIHYDKNKFDFLTEETLTGMGVANTEEDGQIIWGAIFDPENGSDFSNKTDVFNAVLIAKQDIGDLNSEFEFKVRDAYNIKYEKVDASHVSYSVQVEGDSAESNVDSSKSETNESKDVESGSTDLAGSVNDNQSDTLSSAAHESNASEGSEIGAQQETNVETTSRASGNIDESEFGSIPPIKLDTQDSPEKIDRGFPITGAIIAIAVCLVVAAAGTIMLISKKRQK